MTNKGSEAHLPELMSPQQLPQPRVSMERVATRSKSGPSVRMLLPLPWHDALPGKEDAEHIGKSYVTSTASTIQVHSIQQDLAGQIGDNIHLQRSNCKQAKHGHVTHLQNTATAKRLS